MSLKFNDLETFQQESYEWTKHNFPNGKPYQPLLGVAEEVGELCHAHLKAEQGIRDSKEEHKEDAVGDIMIFLADYYNRNNIRMAIALSKTWENVRYRDWIKFPKNGKTE